MLERLQDLPERVLGVRASGEVGAEDYMNVLVPTIEEKHARHAKLRLLYVLGRDFDGFAGSAAWEDAKVGMHHFTTFERIAVVTDIDWIAYAVKALGFVLPGEVRVYGNDDFDAARDWVCEPASPGKLDFEFLEDRGVLVLQPRGELQAGDFRQIAAEIDPYLDERSDLTGLVIVTDEFPGWDDFHAFASHFRFIRDHHSRVRRVALVTRNRFLPVVPRLASIFVDAEVKQFFAHEKDTAISWAAEEA